MRWCVPVSLVLLLSLAIGGGATIAAQQTGAPLTEREIAYLLQKKVSNEALAAMVRSYGVAFQADEGILGRLRAAGANQALLDAIRKQAKARAVEVEVVKPAPPSPEPEAVPAPAREYLTRGQQKMKSYDYEGALREFCEAEKILPQWDEIFRQRGLAFAAMGRFADAASEWKTFKSLAAADVDKTAIQGQIAEWEAEALKLSTTRSLLSKGEGQLQSGDTAGAVRSFGEAVSLSSSVGAYLGLARAQLQGDRYAEAADAAQHARALDPESGLAANCLAEVDLRQGKSVSSLADQAVGANPGRIETCSRRGQTQARSPQLEKTIADLRELIRLNPELADAHLKLANAMITKGDLENAISAFREAIRLRPESVQAHNNLANALRSQGKTEAAIEEYREAIKLSPPQAYLHFNLANALAGAGRYAEAIEQYEVAKRLDPNDPEIHNNLGVAHAAAGNLEKAADEYRQALKMRPAFARSHYNLGLLLERQGDQAAAINEFNEAIRSQEEYPAAHFRLGMALERAGNLQGALKHLRKSWELNPQNLDCLLEYERLLKATKLLATTPTAAN